MNKVKKILLTMTLGSMTSWACAQSLEVTITPLNQSFVKDSDVKVTISVTNTSQDNVKVLSWYLVQNDKLQHNSFDVSVDGEQVSYTGPIVKRPAPTEKDYIQLSSGETINQTIDLSAYYDMTQSGTYNVQYDVKAIELIKDNKKAKGSSSELQKLKSNDVSFWVEGLDPKTATLDEPQISTAAAKFGITYTGSCSNSKKSSISAAVYAAQDLGTDAYNYLVENQSQGSESTRYQTWFGDYSSSRYSTVTDHFYKISNALNNQTMTMDCYCESDLSSAYAYVYPNQPYHIHLCGAFWSASVKGTDSQAGTLIHEMSHFTVNGGTEDLVYGQYNARQLAAQYPSYAVNNADNHEYFAENNPVLQ
jgi:peptidyl-Lys metalloendopeptidase